MKRVAFLIVLQFMLFAGLANAATYRVDINATINGGGSIVGYFTFDDSGLNHPGNNYDLSASMESDLYIEASLGGDTYIFTEDNASVTKLLFIGYDNLYSFSVGGDIGGPASLWVSPEYAPDFYVTNSYSMFLNEAGEYTNTIGGVTFSMSEVEVSAVPLPAAAWMFIAGLTALFGGKWRLKRKALLAA